LVLLPLFPYFFFLVVIVTIIFIVNVQNFTVSLLFASITYPANVATPIIVSVAIPLAILMESLR
jgi:hypothetical protein